ncbi:hypothetical protein ACLESO_01840 [Pyxidicoccus sp. 3LG]
MSLSGFTFASELRGPFGGPLPGVEELLARLAPVYLVDLSTGELRSDVSWLRKTSSPVYEMTGLCRLATTGELSAAFPGSPFLLPLPECPFRGEHLGWLLWTLPDLPEDSSDFGMLLGELSWGRSVDLRTGTFFDAMDEYELPLVDVTNKWGFGDGDLLRGDADYEAYVTRQLEAALQDAGVHERPTSPDTFATLHNGYRLLDFSEETLHRLEGRTVKLWARHPFLVRPGYFFGT